MLKSLLHARIRTPGLMALLAALWWAPLAARADEAPVDEFAAVKRALCDKYQGKVIGQRNGVDVSVSCPQVENSFTVIKFDPQAFMELVSAMNGLEAMDIRTISAEKLFGHQQCAGQAPLSPLPDGGFLASCVVIMPFQGVALDAVLTLRADANGRPTLVEAVVDLGRPLSLLFSRQGVQTNDTLKELLADVMNARMARLATATDSVTMKGLTVVVRHKVVAAN